METKSVSFLMDVKNTITLWISFRAMYRFRLRFRFSLLPSQTNHFNLLVVL